MHEPIPPRGSGNKTPSALLSIAVLALVFSPITQNFKQKPKDNFPLSHFPMFSARRSDTYSANALIGIDETGQRQRLSHKFAGTGGLNQVRRQVREQVNGERASSLCTKVARRVARSASFRGKPVQRIEIVTEKHNVDEFFHRIDRPLSVKVHAACAVPAQQLSKNREVEN